MKDPFAASAAGKPNFFLLGAGRCGTTTLHNMLDQHPEIFMSRVKEPSFFCSYFQVVKDPVSYFQLFRPENSEKAIGEASHVYFSNHETAPVIHQLFPDAKFILIFRSPTERAYSLYNFMRLAKFEPLESFEEAIAAETHRFEDPEFFRNCPQYFWNFMYVRSSYYDQQWQRYLRFFPRSRFFPLSLYELRAAPALWMSRIYEFLGVDAGFTPSFDRLNSFEYPPISAAMKAQLDSHFRDVVSRTEALAGRDLGLGRA